jgi:hypothetical protein
MNTFTCIEMWLYGYTFSDRRCTCVLPYSYEISQEECISSTSIDGVSITVIRTNVKRQCHKKLSYRIMVTRSVNIKISIAFGSHLNEIKIAEKNWRGG